MKNYAEFDIDPIVLPESSSSSSIMDDHGQEPIDMSTTGHFFQSTLNVTETSTKLSDKTSLNKVDTRDHCRQ
jgi:hypothetical protein